MYFASFPEIMGDLLLCQTILRILKAFSLRANTYQGKGNYSSKFKKGRSKTRKLLKITILGEQEQSVVTSSSVMLQSAKSSLMFTTMQPR